MSEKDLEEIRKTMKIGEKADSRVSSNNSFNYLRKRTSITVGGKKRYV